MFFSFIIDLFDGKSLCFYQFSLEVGSFVFILSNGNVYVNFVRIKMLAFNYVDFFFDQLYEMEWFSENMLVYIVVNESKCVYVCYVYQFQYGDRWLLFEVIDFEFELELYEVQGILLFSCLNSNGNELFRIKEGIEGVEFFCLYGIDWYSIDFYFDEDLYYLLVRDIVF